MWDAASAQETLTLRGHFDSVFSVGFSPDGQRIVSGSADDTVKVWDAASGKELLTLRGHSGAVWSVRFSPDGKRIVSQDSHDTVIVWDPSTSTPVQEKPPAETIARNVSPVDALLSVCRWDKADAKKMN